MAKQQQQQQQLCVALLMAFLVVSAMNTVHVDAASLFSFPTRGSHHATSDSPPLPQIFYLSTPPAAPVPSRRPPLPSPSREGELSCPNWRSWLPPPPTLAAALLSSRLSVPESGPALQRRLLVADDEGDGAVFLVAVGKLLLAAEGVNPAAHGACVPSLILPNTAAREHGRRPGRRRAAHRSSATARSRPVDEQFN